MKRLAASLLLCACTALVQAQSQYALFTAANITDEAGNKLASGTFTATPVLTPNSTIPAAPHLTGGGRAVPEPIIFAVTDGVISAIYGTAQLLDVSQANPQNFCYATQVHNNNTGSTWNLDSCLQPAYNAIWCTVSGSQTTCDYDDYVPTGVPGVLQGFGGTSGTVNSGSSGQITYYPASGAALSGATGGLTNGTHWAFGSGATLNGNPTTLPGPSLWETFPASTVNYLSEAPTTPENGQWINLSYTPAANPTTTETGQFVNLATHGNYLNGPADTAVAVGFLTSWDGTGTISSQLEGMKGGVLLEGSGTSGGAYGAIITDATTNGTASAVIDTATELYNSGTNISTHIGISTGYQGVGSSAVLGTDYELYIGNFSGMIGGATIGTAYGIYITDMAQAGVTNPYQLYSASTTAPSVFKGPVQVPVLRHGTLYSASGTALPSCNSGTKGEEAVASDATSPTYLGTYTSGGAVVSPVICNGSNWVTY